ncbi:flagellar motor protein MotA [Candidatus Poribacteria bacterium]|nr:flagellar motor protein MotA [Candidatus Poribacteria bacterium]|tara:strand:+ start:3145 stop:4290 length:1146 start_codon:yes stop_codon:yes gene_type:complete
MKAERNFLIRMLAFLAIVIAVIAVLYNALIEAFIANPVLNGVIIGVLLIGISFSFRRVILLNADFAWLNSMKRRQDNETPHIPPPKLLASLAAMFNESDGRLALSAVNLRSVLDGIGSRIDESREIARYLIGLLIFLGLLGTFWGLLQTITSVGDVIGNMSITSDSDIASAFGNLKGGLEEPLEGMGTAFSSSLFGLAGSLILGFLELQASQAQNRFYNELEEWLSGYTRLTRGNIGVEAGESVPAYVSALLEKTADSLDELQRTLNRGEESRIKSSANMLALTERLSSLAENMESEQKLLTQLAESQLEIKPTLDKIAISITRTSGLDDASKIHLKNIETYTARMVEDVSVGREQIISELRSEIKLLARTIAAIAEEERR